jgi:hypothetical protein
MNGSYEEFLDSYFEYYHKVRPYPPVGLRLGTVTQADVPLHG